MRVTRNSRQRRDDQQPAGDQAAVEAASEVASSDAADAAEAAPAAETGAAPLPGREAAAAAASRAIDAAAEAVVDALWKGVPLPQEDAAAIDALVVRALRSEQAWLADRAAGLLADDVFSLVNDKDGRRLAHERLHSIATRHPSLMPALARLLTRPAPARDTVSALLTSLFETSTPLRDQFVTIDGALDTVLRMLATDEKGSAAAAAQMLQHLLRAAPVMERVLETPGCVESVGELAKSPETAAIAGCILRCIFLYICPDNAPALMAVLPMLLRNTNSRHVACSIATVTAGGGTTELATMLVHTDGFLAAAVSVLASDDSQTWIDKFMKLLRALALATGPSQRAAIASAVTDAMPTASASARERLRKFLRERPMALQPVAIEALEMAAENAARLRGQVAELEAVPVNTRAAIVELAQQVAAGGRRRA